MAEKTVRIDEDLHRQAKIESAKRGVPLQDVLDELLREGLKKQEQQDKDKQGKDKG